MRKRGEAVTEKQVYRGDVYYTVGWSRLSRANKMDILNKVPAVSGIYELYYQDDRKKLVLFFMARVWYGGLRGSLRENTDPLMVSDPRRRQVLEGRECFYRYTMVSSVEDMEDILHFYALSRVSSPAVPEPSGRYREIYLTEETEDRLLTV